MRLYLKKTYVKKSKKTECSRMKCEPISKTRETPSRGWSPKWGMYLNSFPNLLIVFQVTQKRTQEEKQRK